MGGLENGNNNSEPTQPQTEAATAPAVCNRRALEGKSKGEEGGPREDIHDSESPTEKKPRRRMLRKKEVCGEREDWETARRDAWLRELLTDSSEDEPEDGYTRFEESGRWIAKMTGSRDRGHHEPNPGEVNKSMECER
jgi:hypothetical protein